MLVWRHLVPSCLLIGSALACHAPRSGPSEAQSPTDPASDSPGALCIARANADYQPKADAPASISVAHILVRHAELTRPLGATRSRSDACLRALAALEALQGGSLWNDTVAEYSDADQSTHGHLGTISQEDVTPRFALAAFSLEPDELSYVVETDRGFHVILRE